MMMAEAMTSVLLVDYDNLQRSFAAAGGEGQIADTAAVWLAALEDGRLMGPGGGKRRLAIKRCYAGGDVTGKLRDRLTAAGFDVVEAGDGTRGSADLHMAMDTIEALSRPDGFSEFILFSPGSELSPLISRLKSAKRTAIILTDKRTSATDRAMADILIDAANLVRLPTPATPPPAETRAPSAANERAEIEAFARKIHGATNIPLLSPKTYTELFRHLTEEITANGYHFQTTAKNVADRMSTAGRNVTRRQVVFIVKGLALKGHVFSTTDNAERLAEVFREQARYLIGNAGIKLDPREEQLLTVWFQGRPTAAASPARPTPAPAAETSPTVPPSAETRARIAETIEREVAKAVVRPAERSKVQPPRAAAAAAPPAPKPPQVKPVTLPKSTARPVPAQPVRPAPPPAAREEAKAVIAARIAASAKMRKTPARPGSAQPAPNGAPSTLPPEPPAAEENVARTAGRAQAVSSETLETSILAAIAEAVDVLVDDSAANAQSQPHVQEAEPETEEADNEPTEIDEGQSNDIGDQIQRIIASYNRNRLDE
jgi:hypothetical protein